MISIPVHSKLAKMPLRERFSWALSNVWGVGFALFTVWFYVPYCRRRIKQNNGRDAALWKISLGASVVFFVYQLIVATFVIWAMATLPQKGGHSTYAQSSGEVMQTTARSNPFTIDIIHPIWYNFARLIKIIPERECVACLIINHTRKGAVCRRS